MTIGKVNDVIGIKNFYVAFYSKRFFNVYRCKKNNVKDISYDRQTTQDFCYNKVSSVRNVKKLILSFALH